MSSDKSKTMKTSYLALVVLATGLLCVGTAGCKNDNKNKFDASVLFEETLSKAKDGDTDAMLLLGTMYATGEGVIQDDKEAVKWYRKAAELGYVKAMYPLGSMYANGSGVIEDDKEAVKWYRKAAELGHAKAMWALGGMYANGMGVIEDDKEAVKWYRKAAELGNELAMTYLGFMYVTGEGVIEDAVEAYAWINVTAENGQNQKTAAKLRDKIKKTMTPEQIAEGQRRSREIMKSISKN
tara:strand:- start:13 stop:729 length:717 start_codon:yes stop_codon:yes gene_type:complete